MYLDINNHINIQYSRGWSFCEEGKEKQLSSSIPIIEKETDVL